MLSFVPIDSKHGCVGTKATTGAVKPPVYLQADILNVKIFTQTLFFSLKFYPRVRDYNQPKCLTKQRKL